MNKSVDRSVGGRPTDRPTNQSINALALYILFYGGMSYLNNSLVASRYDYLNSILLLDLNGLAPNNCLHQKYQIVCFKPCLYIFQCYGLVPSIEKVLEQGLDPNASCYAAKFCEGNVCGKTSSKYQSDVTSLLVSF